MLNIVWDQLLNLQLQLLKVDFIYLFYEDKYEKYRLSTKFQSNECFMFYFVAKMEKIT